MMNLFTLSGYVDLIYSFLVAYPLLFSIVIFLAGFRISHYLFITLHILSPNNVDNADFRRVKGGNHGLISPEDVLHEYGYISSEKGHILFYQKWMNNSKSKVVRGVIILCHGFGDHSSGFQSRIAIAFGNWIMYTFQSCTCTHNDHTARHLIEWTHTLSSRWIRGCSHRLLWSRSQWRVTWVSNERRWFGAGCELNLTWSLNLFVPRIPARSITNCDLFYQSRLLTIHR